jgi:thiol-disulfide isomerase/thioredoxin
MQKALSLLLLLSITHFESHTKAAVTTNTKLTTKPKPVKKALPKKQEVTVITVDSSNFEKLVLNSKTPILLDVYADWCGPCRRMSPIFEEVSQKCKGKKITFAKIKMDGFEESDKHIKLLKEKLGTSISMIPTFLYIEKGKLVEQIVGSQSAPNLNTKIASLMSKSTQPTRNLA